MIRAGENWIDGIPVEVERKRIRRINIRVDDEGRVRLSVPKFWATLREAEEFLLSKWDWVTKTREKARSRPQPNRAPLAQAEIAALETLLAELNDAWAVRLNEPGMRWQVRHMKSLWGSCNWRLHRIVYALELARVPRDLVEYVVVHEFTHFAAHDHGPGFQALMDARMPDWRTRRRRLNKRLFAPPPAPETASAPEVPPAPEPAPATRLVQGTFW